MTNCHESFIITPQEAKTKMETKLPITARRKQIVKLNAFFCSSPVANHISSSLLCNWKCDCLSREVKYCFQPSSPHAFWALFLLANFVCLFFIHSRSYHSTKCQTVDKSQLIVCLELKTTWKRQRNPSHKSNELQTNSKPKYHSLKSSLVKLHGKGTQIKHNNH